MSKNKKYIITLILILIIIGASSFGIIKYKQKKAEEERLKEIAIKVNNINNKYASFSKNEKLNTSDELSLKLNQIIDTHDSIMSLENDQKDLTLKDLKNIDDTEKNINSEINLASTYNYDDITPYIERYTKEEQDAIKKIYNKSSIVQNENNDKEIKTKYITKKNNDLNFVKFLKDNKNNYTIDNNKIIYKTDDFKNNFLKYNDNIELEKYVYKGKKIPILMYHGIADKAWGDTTLFVKTNDFEEQIKYLSDNGYTALFLSEISKAENYDKPIIITFDDGYKNVYDNAYPILKKYNMKADFFVITDWLDGETYVTPEMVKEMSNYGIIEIGSHTLNHAALGTVNEEKQDEELKKSKEELDTLLGKETLTVAYPLGSYTSTTIKLARKYYKYGVTVSKGFNYSKNYWSLSLNRNKITRNMSLTTFKTEI
jgi:peptidoglycan/xylan/chitin deacetylase (PgdA/CDA1 family)